MILEAIVISGAVLVGKRIYAQLTNSASSSLPSTKSGGKHKKPNVEDIPERERSACRHLAASGSGLTLALGSVIGSPVLGLLSITVLGSAFVPLVRDGWREFREHGRLNYGVLVTAVTAGSIAAGYLTLTALAEIVYFGSEVLLAKTRRQARESVQGMFDDWPVEVWVRLENNTEIAIPLVDLAPGDVVVVRAGEPIPVDGVVVAGAAGVDQSAVTGESVVAERTIGDKVFASTLLVNGSLDIRVEQAGEKTLAGEIAKALDRMESYEESVENRGVEVAEASVNPTLAVAALGWLGRGPMGALAVASSNFADSGRLSCPLSMLNHIRIAADAGIQIKDGHSLELVGDVDTVVFDKTGTLTAGNLQIIRIWAAEEWREDKVLALAAAAEERQQHPIAVAIREASALLPFDVPPGQTITNSAGNGITAMVEGNRIHVGSLRYFEQEGIPVASHVREASETEFAEGRTVVQVACQHQWIGRLVMLSSLRPEAAAVIARFKSAGYQTAILSGDHEGPTKRLAKELGVDMWRAGVLPQEKTRFIEDLQADGRSVCFVGDGINDGMALKAANVSVSLNGASLLATDVAQVVLQDASLDKLWLLFDLAKRYRSDQKLVRGSMMTTSIASASGALFLHFTVPLTYLIYSGTVIAGGVIAMSPMWRRIEGGPSHRRLSFSPNGALRDEVHRDDARRRIVDGTAIVVDGTTDH